MNDDEKRLFFRGLMDSSLHRARLVEMHSPEMRFQSTSFSGDSIPRTSRHIGGETQINAPQYTHLRILNSRFVDVAESGVQMQMSRAGRMTGDVIAQTMDLLGVGPLTKMTLIGIMVVGPLEGAYRVYWNYAKDE